MAINTRAYIEQHLKIKDKAAKVIPFKLNAPQIKLYNALKAQSEAGKPQRAVILKARQMGFSTLTEAILFKNIATGLNVRAGIVAHKETATANLFNMFRLFYDNLPAELRFQLKASNAQELAFKDTGSSIRCMTAGGDGIGRSDTFQKLHISEYAFWKGDKKVTLLGLLQAVPNNPDTLIIIESTANGYDDFKDIWDRACRGESDFTPVFCAWWELSEYRMKYTGFELGETEQQLKADYSLDLEQIAWRRWCIQNNCGGDEELFKQEYPSNPYEAFITSGRCVFRPEIVQQRLAQALDPIKIGRFVYNYDGLVITEIRWESDPRGPIKIYKDAKQYYPYVLGGDTAGEGSDFFTGHVLDNTTGEQIAVLRHQYDEDEYARQMYCLGWAYNNALIGVEANFSTYPIRELTRLGYGWQYVRENLDSNTGRTKRAYGFKTTSATRPNIIAKMVTIARESIELINNRETLQEMLTFIRNDDGRPEAQQGAHDDCIMGLAIAHQIRDQQVFEVNKPAVDEDVTPYEDQINGLIGYGRY